MKRNSWRLLFPLIMAVSIMATAYCQSDPDCCHCPPEPLLQRSGAAQYSALLYELQQYWQKQSLYSGEPNGRFDQAMEAAVLDFQKQHRLKPNGMIDRDTWRAIGAAPEAAGSIPALPPGRLEILIELNSLTLTVLIDRKPFQSFPVAIGKVETPSPVGAWRVTSKGYWVKGETNWLGLSVPYGVYGIHGTNQPWTIGRRASNGCIRMYNRHLESVYRWARPGTPVYIDGDPFRDRRELKRGMSGPDVYFLQIRLKQLGFFEKRANGYFEYWTEEGVKKCQQSLGLPVTGAVSAKEYYRLKLYPTN